MHRGVATVMFRVIADGVAGLLSLGGPYAAPRHSCKYRWLHAPATITNCTSRSPVSGDLVAF